MTVLALSVAAGASAGAQQPARSEDEAVPRLKEVTGQVGFVRPAYLTVVYRRDAEKNMDHEMIFPLDEDVALQNKREFRELRSGDTVTVTYEEKRWVGEDGGERAKRKATRVRFIRSESTGLRSGG